MSANLQKCRVSVIQKWIFWLKHKLQIVFYKSVLTAAATKSKKKYRNRLQMNKIKQIFMNVNVNPSKVKMRIVTFAILVRIPVM